MDIFLPLVFSTLVQLLFYLNLNHVLFLVFLGSIIQYCHFRINTLEKILHDVNFLYNFNISDVNKNVF